MLCLAGVASIAHADSKDLVELKRVAEAELNARVRVGQELLIRTMPAPVTAYRWEVISEDQSAVERVPYRCADGLARDPLLGGDEPACFEFVGRTAGKAILKFAKFAGHSYPGKDIADEFCVVVTVSD